jgi:hypothetical protein
MTKITVNGKTSNVVVRTVGQCFATEAHCTVDGRRYDSETRPLGFASAAIEDVVTQVTRDFPAARIAEVD